MANPTRGLFAIEDEHGEFTIAELLSATDIELGDVLEGDLHSLGSETFAKVRSKNSVRVFVEDIHASAARAREMLR